MHYASAFVLAAAAGLAAAQTSSSTATSPSSTGTSSSGCGTQLDSIIALCLDTTQPQVEACDSNDWSCLCGASEQVDTCYNNCPSHPDAFGQQQTTRSYCDAADVYDNESSSSASTTATATGAGAGSTNTAASTSSESGTAIQTGFASDASSSGAAASASESGNAASGFAPAGGLLAAIFGLALI